MKPALVSHFNTPDCAPDDLCLWIINNWFIEIATLWTTGNYTDCDIITHGWQSLGDLPINFAWWAKYSLGCLFTRVYNPARFINLPRQSSEYSFNLGPRIDYSPMRQIKHRDKTWHSVYKRQFNIHRGQIKSTVYTSKNIDTLRPGDVLVCRRFGLSMFWYVDVSVCRGFGISTFWFVDVLVHRRFSLSTFRFVDVSFFRRFGCRRFGFVDVLASYR